MLRNIFKWVALAEGLSWLCLLIAMVFKYGYDMPEGVSVVGMIHGWLFIAYVVVSFLLWRDYRLSPKTMAVILLGSVIPMGAWYVERHIDRMLPRQDSTTSVPA